MSYSIFRIAKVKASGVTGIQIHDQREKDGTSHTNKDIDWSKTKENISLIEQNERFRTAVSKRISALNLKRKPRSDATVMCQCLVTSDNAFFDKMSRSEQTEYFKQSLDFIKKRYGENNLVSATVHYDERTPHMHVNFVPVTEDGRLSAKDLFSPTSLRVLQDDYNRFVRENGHDLQRGEVDSKTKHLEVEEYKLETKYQELKEKEIALERLDKVDKKIDLKADKGKLTYSTKEVDAIKVQNKAIKVDSYKKDEEINELKNNLDTTRKQLKKVENELESTKQPLSKLNALEIENRALTEFRKSNPNFDKSMEQFDELKEQSYSFGNKLLECKKTYHDAINMRDQLIECASKCAKMVKELSELLKDIVSLHIDINNSQKKEKVIKTELEGLKGIIKTKARDDCQKRLSIQQDNTKSLIERLKTTHKIDFKDITSKVKEYTNQQQKYEAEKISYIEQTNKIEQVRDKAVYDYKYNKALSDCQHPSFKAITKNIKDREKFNYGEEKIFRLTQADRKQLIKDFKDSNVDQQTINQCEKNFDKQDVREREERDLAKANKREFTTSRTL